MTGGGCDVPIGVDVDTSEEVALRYLERTLGTAIIGKSGRGKSTILEHLIMADLRTGTPGLVIDPHGQLAENVVSLAPPEIAHRIILLEVDDAHPFGLNLLEVDTSRSDYMTWASDSVIDTVKKLYGQADEYAPLLEKYLDLAVRALIPNNGTVVDIPKLYRDVSFRHACLRNVRDEEVIGEFRAYDDLRSADQAKEVQSVVNRLGRVLRSTAFRKILGSKTTTVPFNDVFDGETMLVVSLPSDRLSPDRCDFMGALLLCAFAQRVFSRSAVSRLTDRVHLYLDEYQRFATITTAELLTQGRKFKAGVTMAHQDLHSIRDEIIRNASRHAGSLITLALTRPDAETLAGEFPVPVREECVEELTAQDGFESETVVTTEPGLILLTKHHSDPAVTEAAVKLFSADSVPRTRGVVLAHPAREAQVWTWDYNAFDATLIQAMKDGCPKPAALANFLFDEMFPQDFDPEDAVRERVAYNFLPFIMDGCLEWIDIPISEADPPGRPQRTFTRRRFYDPSPQIPLSFIGPTHYRPILPHNKMFTKVRPFLIDRVALYNNTQLLVLMKVELQSFMVELRKWFAVHVQHLQAMSARDVKIFREADAALSAYCAAHRWSANEGGTLLMWHGQDVLGREPDRFETEQGTALRKQLEAGRADVGISAVLQKIREQITYTGNHLYTLCRGLAAQPLTVTTGNLRPRMRTQHIVHSAQTDQDARNEFASTLVNPTEKYVAHVKMLTAYHPTKLNAPLSGHGDPEQVGAVRERSQAVYRIPDDPSDDSAGGAVPPGPPSGSTPSPRPIGRWPGPQ